MKVLVHLNHGGARSVMLDFGRNLDKETVNILLKGGVEQTVKTLIGYASLTGVLQEIEVSAETIKQVERQADLTISQIPT